MIKMEFSDSLGGGISNSKVVTKERKYSLDVVQNNPDIEGTLASKIKKLETSSPIAIKEIRLENIPITIKSSNGLYYGRIDDFFTNNEIDVNKVIAITRGDWEHTANIFDTYIAITGGLGFLSPISQTIGMVVIRVAYLNE